MINKRKNSVLVLLLLSLSTLQFQCEKKFGCAANVYSFGLGIQAYPDKDSLNVGDTIWFEINEPVNLKDAGSQAMIDYSGAANLGSVISFHQLSSLGQFTIKATDKFGLILHEGTQVDSREPASERQYIFEEENQHYIFRLGIVASETGIFRLLFSNAANVYRKNDQCTKASFAMNFKNTNQHYYLSPFYQGGTFIGGDYYFKVY